MAKLAEPLMGVKHRQGTKTGVVKSHFVLLVLFLLLTKVLRSYNSGMIAGFTLKVTPMNCAYWFAEPFGIKRRIDKTTDFLILNYCDPFWGIHFFTIISYKRLWSVHAKIY